MAEIPIDKGVAWFVLIGAFMCGFLVVGGFKSVGILFVHVLEKYEASQSLTAWMMGLMSFGLAVYSPVATAVGMRYTYRVSVMLGGFAMHLGFLLCAFAPNVYFVICVLGGLVGFANGFLYTPSMIMVGQYFNQQRSLAMGIAAAGGSFGQLIIPLIIRFLLDYYGYWGCMLIYSGIVLNGVVAGALLRPQSFYKKHRQKADGHLLKTEGISDARQLTQTPTHSMNSLVFRRQIQDSVTSTPVNGLEKSKRAISLNSIEETILHSGPDIPGKEKDNQVDHEYDDSSEQASSEPLRDSEDCNGDQTGRELAVCYRSTGSVQMVDINVAQTAGGSISPCDEDGDEHIDDILHKKENMCIKCCTSCMQPFTNLFDKVFLTKFVFWLYFVAVALSNAGYIDQFLFIPPFAKEIGISKFHTASVLAASGVADLVGRVSGGFLNSFQLLEVHILISLTLFGAAVTAMITLMFSSYVSILIHGIAVGLIGGMYISLFPIVLVHIIGLGKFPQAFACTMMGVGLMNLPLPTLFGKISEARGSYTLSFLLLNIMMIVGGLLFLLIPRVQEVDNRRQRKDTPESEAANEQITDKENSA